MKKLFIKTAGTFFSLLIAVVLVLIVFNGCVKLSLEDTGSVKHIELEGGFYGIVGDDGQKFDPVNLKEDFKKDGLKVKFVYSLKQNIQNIHQWGKTIEIISIRKI